MMSHLIQSLLQMNMNEGQGREGFRGGRGGGGRGGDGQHHGGRGGGQHHGGRGGYHNPNPKFYQDPQNPQQRGAHPQQPQAPVYTAPTTAGPQDQKARYMEATMKVLPSVQEKNPYIKEQVGHVIYDYVQGICGAEKAPKVTGMLIELPIDQIRQYMSSFDHLQMRVFEAVSLIDKSVDSAQSK